MAATPAPATDENAQPPAPAMVAPPPAANAQPRMVGPSAPTVAGIPPGGPENAQPLTQEQQIDAIRKRIEARRAQARAEEIQELSGQK
jgi:general secretion pathway protein N